MRGDGAAPSDVRLHGMQLYVNNLDESASNDARWQVLVRGDHRHADVDGQDARELCGRADVGLAAHVVEVLPAHPDGRDFDGGNVV